MLTSSTALSANIRAHLNESIVVKQALLEMTQPIEGVCQLLIDRIRAGHKVVLFGNGGSAADAQHIAAELLGRLEQERACLPAIALTTDPSTMTAIANDYGYDQVFVRQVKAHVRAEDVVIGISTSGNSKNVVEGLRAAQTIGATTVGLAGKDGGLMAAHCNHLICVPSKRTMRIQECHITIGHILCHAVEQAVLDPLTGRSTGDH